jgi:hypothetical protein
LSYWHHFPLIVAAARTIRRFALVPLVGGGNIKNLSGDEGERSPIPRSRVVCRYTSGRKRHSAKSSRGSVAIDIFRYKKDASPANSK